MSELRVERSDGVVTVTIDRPERRNAVPLPMWADLADLFDEIANRSEDRVVVLTGAGGAFCSGADLSSSAGTSVPPLTRMRNVARAAVALQRLPKPTIARVDGAAVGAGLGLALACDLVVASEQARFCAVFSQRAMSTDFATSWLLPRLVGLQKAKQLVLFGDMLDAAAALALGLVTAVVARADLDRTVGEWAARLAANPQLAVSLSKDLLNRSFDMTLEQSLEAEAQAQALNLFGPDVAEGRKAFVEKRPPRYGTSL